MTRSAGPGLALGLFFGALGGLFLWSGLEDLLPARRFVARAARTEGTVAAIAPGKLADVQTVTFTAAGRTVEFRSNPARVPSPVGARVPVLYDPDRPEVAEVDRFEELYRGIYVRLAIAAFLLLGAGGFLGSAVAARRVR